MRRLLLTIVVLGSMALPVAARADDDLEVVLESAAEADFHGVGVVMCTWDGDSAATTYEVTRSHGMSMVHGPDGDFMLTGGLAASRSGADWYALEVGEWSAWSLSDRYSLGDPVATSRLGRPATEVMVMEGEVARARLVIDDASTVPLLTEILDGAGNVFRLAAMIEFDAEPAPMDMPGDFHEHEMLMSAEPTDRLPETAFGYRRVDSYASEKTIQAFYSDGLFSFSVFESKRSSRPEDFAGATRFEVAGESYLRIVTPSNVWVQWDAPDRSYVLVGDLPPDHILAVLEELPEPGDRGFIVRLWRRLFG